MKYDFIAPRKLLISELISENVPGLSKPALKTLFNSGEIKLNGLKQKIDVSISKGDKIYVFVPQKFLCPVDAPIIYSDQNILIVDKPRLTDVENNLTSMINKDFPSARPMHRLDRNTAGLVVFALNQDAYNALFDAFKSRKIDKYYYALVRGNFKNDGEYIAYLKKDAQKSLVSIANAPLNGYKQIISHFKFIKKEGNDSLIEARLITGCTHQLRAHLAHISHPILGDNKYGESDSKYKYQQLIAYKIVFNGLKEPLEYLNQKEFQSKTPLK